MRHCLRLRCMTYNNSEFSINDAELQCLSEFGYTLTLDGAPTESLHKLTWPLTVCVYVVGGSDKRVTLPALTILVECLSC